MEALNEKGIVKQMSSARRNRYFEATDIISEFTCYERSLATESGDTRNENPSGLYHIADRTPSTPSTAASP